MKIQSPKAGIGTGRAGLQAASGLFSSAGLFQKGVKAFHPNDLDPYLLFDARDSMLDASLETASFLEPVPVLRNLARGSNKGGDAEQSVALNQPKALPLIDGDGYLYCPPISGNYASIPDEQASDLEGFNDFTFEIDVALADWTPSAQQVFFSKYSSSGNGYQFLIQPSGTIGFTAFYGGSVSASYSSVVNFANGQRVSLRVKRTGTSLSFEADEGAGFYSISTTVTPAGALTASTTQFQISGWHPTVGQISGAIFGIKIWEDSTQTSKVLDVDFTSPNVRHGATKFKCATGQVVTINQSGNNPATVIKKPVLRFDGVDDCFQGLFANNIDGGYMFAAFSVLGDGGEPWGRVFTTNLEGIGNDYNGTGAAFSLRNSGTTGLRTMAAGLTQTQTGMFDDANGDILHEVKLEGSDFSSKVNNAGLLSATHSGTIDSDRFNIGRKINEAENPSIDLEYLALFPASITDEQADAVRNYINNRNNVFDLKDGFGYYFYDAQKAPVGNISSGSASWNGRIVGSDNGDTDKLATQATANDQPVGDGYVVTFADNSDFLTIPSTTQAGWQVVGTSLGTFAYRVNSNAVTELNLLGNLGNPSFRQVGDLYGVILLPESATGADIEEARKLLIDRGASVSATADVTTAWRGRGDIVQFDGGAMSDVTNASRAWQNCSSLTSFSSELPSATNVSNAWNGCSSLTSFSSELPSATNVSYAWNSCSSLSDFKTTDIKNCTNFTNAWQDCSALTSFPAGAKLGTSASNVNFNNAWRSSGLTSFSTPLPTAASVRYAWQNCTSLESFSTDLPSANNVTYAWQGCTSLTSFSTELPSATILGYAWRGCSSLTSFSTDLPSAIDLSSSFQDCTQLEELGQIQSSNVTNWYYTFYNCRALTEFPVLDASSGTDFFGTWRNCIGLIEFPLLNCNNGQRFSWAWNGCSSLEDFPAGFFNNWNPTSLSDGAFGSTWNGCPLTAQSVENILTSIDASGKYATSTGASGGTALPDAGIDIDYNVATGSLSAATTAAITSLKSKGWSIFINSVEQ